MAEGMGQKERISLRALHNELLCGNTYRRGQLMVRTRPVALHGNLVVTKENRIALYVRKAATMLDIDEDSLGRVY